MAFKWLKLCEITPDRDIQIRDRLDDEKVAEYAEAMAAGDKFPRLVVFFDKLNYWLAGGNHRYSAAQSLGLDEIECDVREGTKRDAVFFAMSDNKHGVHLSNAEKRRAVERMVEDPEWSKFSDRQVARHIGVSVTFVGSVRDPEVAARRAANREKSHNGSGGVAGLHQSPSETPPVQTPPDRQSTTRRGECENLTQPSSESVIKSQSSDRSDRKQESAPLHESAVELAARTDAVAIKPFSLPRSDEQSSTVSEERKVSPTSLQLAERARDEALETAEDLRSTAAELHAEVEAYRAAETGEGEVALVAANKRILKLEGEIRRLESIRDGLMNDNAELKKQLKRVQRQLESGHA